jgi:hypothetical protein
MQVPELMPRASKHDVFGNFNLSNRNFPNNWPGRLKGVRLQAIGVLQD